MAEILERAFVSLVIELFGAFRISRNGAPVPGLGQRKARWLLALLALRHGRPVRREELAEALWPNAPPKTQAENLRQALNQLRGALGDREKHTRIQGPADDVWLDLSDAWVDVIHFDHAMQQEDTDLLGQAIRLRHDVLLKGCDEPWAEGEREKRERAYLRALLTLAERALHRGGYAEAEECARKAIAQDPEREAAWRLLMQAQAGEERLAAAKQTWRNLLKVVDEPDPQTRAVFAQIEEEERRRARVRRSAPSPETPAAPPPGNLPQIAEIVGREQHIQEVRQRLLSARLLTLTGAGGVGKTSLAIHVADRLREHYRDGVWFVDLAPLADPALVPQAVASALNVAPKPGQSLTDALAEHLKTPQPLPRSLLIVLDNCEHLIDACARLAQTLLQSCRGLRMLATSRHELGIDEETVWRVPSLSLPDPKKPLPVGERLVPFLSQYGAIQWFVKAAQARADFALTAANAPTILEICRRLDGIPLAIRLAASRLPTLSVEQIAAGLQDRFGLLQGGSRTALPRHQTLRALIDWSYGLLSEPERVLLCRLAVFAGGWTLEAAEATCAGEPVRKRDLADRLAQLVRHSLVEVERSPSCGNRYRLLETVRQYALENLSEAGEAEPLRARHFDWFLPVSEKMEEKITGAQQALWLPRLECDHDNFRTALAWAAERRPEGALSMATGLWRFWEVRGYWEEGLGWLEAALRSGQGGAEHEQRGHALTGAGGLAYRLGRYETATSYMEESLAIWRRLDRKRSAATLLNNLGVLAYEQRDYDAAVRYYEEGRTTQEELGDRTGLGKTLNNLAIIAWSRGESDRARLLYEEALAIKREIGDAGDLAGTLNNLGALLKDQGDHQAAKGYLEESRRLLEKLGREWELAYTLCNLADIARSDGDLAAAFALYDDSLTQLLRQNDRRAALVCLEGFAQLAAAQSRWKRSVWLFGAGQTQRALLDVPMTPVERGEYEKALNQARAGLGTAAFQVAFEAGRAATLDEAVSYART